VGEGGVPELVKKAAGWLPAAGWAGPPSPTPGGRGGVRLKKALVSNPRSIYRLNAEENPLGRKNCYVSVSYFAIESVYLQFDLDFGPCY